MSTPTFFHKALAQDDDIVTLSATESSHAAGARRMRVGQAVSLINGAGLIAAGRILELQRRTVTVQLAEVNLMARVSPQLTIATAIPKGDRQKVMIDMLAQLGVAKIVPLAYEYSVTRYTDKIREKWLRYAIEACKQSGNPWLPQLAEPQTLDDFLVASNGLVLAADATGVGMSQALKGSDQAVFVIGPEGGFSSSEYEKMRQSEVRYVDLGPYILRTEAAAVACASQWVNIVRL